MKIKFKYLHLALLALSLACEPASKEPIDTNSKKDVPFTDEEGLHTKYAPLLKTAAAKVDTKVFDKIRSRCDHQVMPWIENALDAIENGVPYTAKGAESGMGNYGQGQVPKTPRELIVLFLNKDQRCGLADYIERVESTIDPSHKDFTKYTKQELDELKKFIQDMKDMQADLKVEFSK